MREKLEEGIWESNFCKLKYFLKHIKDEKWEIISLTNHNSKFDLYEDNCKNFLKNNHLIKGNKELDKKFMKITFQNEDEWLIPCRIIAMNKAKVCSEHSKETNSDDVYAKVYEDTMNNFDLLVSWSENNMVWEDIKPFAICIKKGVVKYDWNSSTKKLLELNDYMLKGELLNGQNRF